MDNIPIPKPRTTVEVENVKRPVPLPRCRESSDVRHTIATLPTSSEDTSAASLKNANESVHIPSVNRLSASIAISDEPISPISGHQSYSNVILSPPPTVNPRQSSSPRPRKSAVVPTLSPDPPSFNIQEQDKKNTVQNSSPCTSTYMGYKEKYEQLNQKIEIYDSPKSVLPARTGSWLLYETVSNASSGGASVADEAPSVTASASIDASSFSRSSILQPVNLLAYENWSVKKQKTLPNAGPNRSTISEFDPLVIVGSQENNHANDLSLLEAFLNGDTYSNSEIAHSSVIPNSLADETEADKFDYSFYLENSSFFLPPPTPPERYDSLSSDKIFEGNTDNEKPASEVPQKKSQWFDTDATDPNVPLRSTSTKLVDRIHSRINRASRLSVVDKMTTMLKILPESTSYFKKKFDPVYIPAKIVSQSNCTHQGNLVRVLTRVMDDFFKNFQSKQFILSDQKLTCYSDNDTFVAKEVFNLKTLSSVQIILAHDFKYEGELYCFQLFFLNNKVNRASVILGCPNVTERSIWIQKIVQSICHSLPVKYVSDLNRIGWCYIKERVGGTWDPKWLVFRKRSLHYYCTQETFCTLDLRKARFVGLLQSAAKKNSPGDGPTLLLDFPDITLYIRMSMSVETRIWHHIIKIAASNNGAWIHHYQLTKNDVPTIVDKCINYIYLQGSLSEGIYRRAGSTSTVSALLTAFRKDAWAVQLTSRDYTEHDVATTLKRFFRDLPEPILTSKLREQLCSTSELTKQEDKVKLYRDLIDSLHPVSKNTLKKLLGHLHFIQLLCEDNLMNTSNLASIWGPTLMKCSDSSNQASWSVPETKVVYDLIHLYIEIYQPTAADISRESKMLAVLQKCQSSTTTLPSKPSGELHIWVYIGDLKSGNCVNTTLKPGKTCGQLCTELSSKVKIEPHLLCIEEVICSDSMSRPLHHSEMLLDVVLRWGYWEEIDRKDNYLVLKENIFMREITSQTVPSNKMLLSGELKFANEKTKNFKLHTFNFCISKLSCYKDKECTVSLASWNIEDIRWYIGHENKRNPLCKWSLTFILKNSKPIRSKDSPWFGCTMAGNSYEDELKWIRAFLLAEYSGNMLPIPQLAVV